MGKHNKHWKIPFMGNKTGPHPRNIYQGPPNIKQLAIQFPELRPFVHNELSGKVTINYKDREALCALVKLLLKKDFDLNVDFPDDRLVPVLPLRLNYVLWIEDLLNMIPPASASDPENVRGIDIGTGAGCIYCLLAVRQCKWHMLATELDVTNYEYAKSNIDLNSLQDKITAKKVNEGTFLVGAVDENVAYDFCMCNPPFFSSEEACAPDNPEKDRTGHRPLPKGACTGSSIELVAPGGEVAFITGIINDSKTLGQKVKIYTSMMGHRKSLDVIGPQLVDLVGSEHVVVTTFQQGHVTRWGVAWTFDKCIKLSDGSEQQPKSKPAKAPVEYVRTGTTLEAAVERVRYLLDRIQVLKKVIEKRSGEYSMELKAYEATWQNQRKRRRKEERKLRQMKRLKLESSLDVAQSSLSEGSLRTLEDIQSKEDRLIDGRESEPIDNKLLLLHAIIILKGTSSESVKIQMSPADCTSGWDSVFQLMTYLKNQWDRDLVTLTK